MRTKLCWRHSRNFHFFISACSLMMVISFYLLFICTDYFLYKLELYFYWLHVSFFIVRALKKFHKPYPPRLSFGFLFVGLQQQALHGLTRKALPLQSIQKSLDSKCSMCVCVHVCKMNSLYAPCLFNPYISTPQSPSTS